MMKNLLYTLLFCALSTIYVQAQNNGEFIIADTNFTTCSGTFLDTGGVTGNYDNGENLTTTFSSFFATDKIQLTFQSFALATGDIMLIYDGPDDTAPLLGVFFANNSPGTVVASAANTSGSLTVRFISDSTNTGAGWTAAIACIDNCQTISNIVTTTPAPDADGIVRICQGDTVNFSGTTTFSVDGTGATNEYEFSEDTMANVSGTTASRTYNDPGIYRVDYITTDTMMCRDRDVEDVLIFVSTTPDFTGTQAADTVICFGESTTISGMVETTEFVAQVAPPVAGLTFLPDDNGTTFYETCIDVQGFAPGATITAASDLRDFFIDMEHSFLGDLDITLTSPNGAVLNVKTGTFAGGGTFLGVPIDDTTSGPGTGLVYTFTEAATATQTLVQASAAVATIPAGDYLAEDPFSLFIGTPLNGLWCLRIVDTLSSDDGYIFEWGLNFNPAIIPAAERYEPDPATSLWVANPDITSTNMDDIVVTPTTSGQNCFDYLFTDSFGCDYTETVCIEVGEEITSAQPTELIVCQSPGSPSQVDLTTRSVETLNGLDATRFTTGFFTTQNDADNNVNAIAAPGSFSVTNNSIVFIRVEDSNTGCFVTEQLSVTFTQTQFTQVPDLEECDDITQSGTAQYDLTVQTATILGTQAASDFTVAYFTTQADATNNTNPITNAGAYNNISNPQTIFVRVTNNSDVDCFTTGTFQLLVTDAPVIGTVADIVECDDAPLDGILNLNLNDNDAFVLNGMNAADFTITYHNDPADANAGNNNLGATYGATTGEILFARLTDNNTGCFNTTSFMVTVEVCEITIPEGFSPNGDMVNDTFVIPNIEQYPNFELMIFNRYGSKIYETRGSNYEEFAGIPNTGTGAGDDLLPVGTYYYVIKYNDSALEDVASWVYINY